MSAPARPDQHSKTAAEQGPLSPLGVRLLKIAIVVMGIMIVVGVAVAIGRIIYLASNTGSDNVATQSAPGPLAPRHTLSLPEGARITQTSLNGDRLLVRYVADGRTELAIYDLHQGRLLSTVVFGAAKTAPGAIPIDPAGSRQ